MNTSILIGAGFSAPLGFPIGREMNESVVNTRRSDYHVHTDEHLIKGQNPNPWMPMDQYWRALCSIIQYYSQNKIPDKSSFDYEVFYDFLVEHAFEDSDILKLLASNAIARADFELTRQKTQSLYQQLIASILADYHQSFDVQEKYAGFANFVNKSCNNGKTSIFSLNHDLVVENLAYNEMFDSDLDDGFSGENSPYSYQHTNGEVNELLFYTGHYSSRLTFHKLHGSINYYKVYAPTKSDSKYGRLNAYDGMVLCSYRFGELYKEGVLCMPSVDPFFLTGRSSKLADYDKNEFSKEQMGIFDGTLSDTNVLLIIGYGFKDDGINLKINKCLKSDTKVIVIDKFLQKDDVLSRLNYAYPDNVTIEQWDYLAK